MGFVVPVDVYYLSLFLLGIRALMVPRDRKGDCRVHFTDVVDLFSLCPPPPPPPFSGSNRAFS